MAESAKSREWPLVLFTLALQLSCGLVLALTLSQTEARPANIELIRTLGAAAFPVAVLGALASVLHLGHPRFAWRSLTNLRQSRLSKEVLLTGIYAASCAAYSWTLATGHVAPLWLGAVTATLGIAAIVASAMIYMVPSQPAWNSMWVLGSFLGTMLTLGGLATVTVAATGSGVSTAYSAPVAMIVAGAALTLASALRMMVCSRRLPPEHPGVHETGRRLGAQQCVLVALHVALACAAPLVVAVLAGAPTFALAGDTLLVTLLVAAFCGALLGRVVMYSLVKDAF